MLSENNAQLSSKSHLSEAGRPGRLAYTLALISRSQLPMNIFSAANIFTRQKVFYYPRESFSLDLLRNDEATIRTFDNRQLSIAF